MKSNFDKYPDLGKSSEVLILDFADFLSDVLVMVRIFLKILKVSLLLLFYTWFKENFKSADFGHIKNFSLKKGSITFLRLENPNLTQKIWK